jgi:hypothetical protein
LKKREEEKVTEGKTEKCWKGSKKKKINIESGNLLEKKNKK